MTSSFQYQLTSARRKSGITILELLVFIVSVSLLTSIVLPAVLGAREVSHNLQCTDRLRQIGLALHKYATAHGTFPAGWTLDRTGGSGYSWAAAILPQLNEDELNSQIDCSRPIAEVGPVVRRTTPTVYLCPSDYGGADFPLFAELGEHGASAQQSTLTLVTLPRANYMGVFGTSEPDEAAGNSGDGIFLENHSIRQDEISRGMSRVFMIGERTTRKLSSTWLGVAMAGEDAGGRIVGCAASGPNRDNTDECEFDSRHFGHVNFTWADGHVSGVRDEIDKQVYRQLAQRQ